MYARCSIGNRTYEFKTEDDSFTSGQKVWVNTSRGETKARFEGYVDTPEYEGDLQSIIGPREDDE